MSSFSRGNAKAVIQLFFDNTLDDDVRVSRVNIPQNNLISYSQNDVDVCLVLFFLEVLK